MSSIHASADTISSGSIMPTSAASPDSRVKYSVGPGNLGLNDAVRRRRPAVSAAICFAAGVAVDRWLAVPWTGWLGGGLLLGVCWLASISRRNNGLATLFLLVCAFGERDFIFKAYRKAIREKYRFFSYGDAMLIL